jgi:16S rRNA processing protein RimM
MTRENPQFLVVGHLSKPHGTRGEFVVTSLTDRPDQVFEVGRSFRLSDGSGNRPEIGLPALVLSDIRQGPKGLLALFEGINERSQAQIVVGRYLLVPYADLPPLPEGELHYHEVLGLRVRTVGGDEVGRVQEVFEMDPHDLLEVAGPGGARLIPFNPGIVVEVNREEGTITIDPPEGLLDL